MSFESILLLAVFLLLPLIQRWLQAQRSAPDLPDETEPAPRPRPRTPVKMPPPPVPDGPPLATPPVVSPDFSAHAVSARRALTGRQRTGPVSLARTPRRRRRGGTVARLRDPLELRRTIVLAAVLGPCRAIRAYDGPPADDGDR